MLKITEKLMSVLLAVLLLATLCLPANAANTDLTDKTEIYEFDVPVSAEAYMLISLDGGEHNIIAQKNMNERLYPASLTKIATVAVALGYIDDFAESVTVSQRALDTLANSGARVAGLKAGESITYEELLYLTLVYSACDSCQVLAEAVGGTIEGFIDTLNAWVKEIGCTDTHFVNAHGLHDDNHYSTAEDLAKITLAALENDTFVKIATTTSYTFRGKTYLHSNLLLNKDDKANYREYASGIKTGTTRKAGSCLITLAEKDNLKYLAVLLKSTYYYDSKGVAVKGVFNDARQLLDTAFEKLGMQTVAAGGSVQGSIPVIDGKEAKSVELVASDGVKYLLPKDEECVFVINSVNMPQSLEAPVGKGQPVCQAEILYRDIPIATVQLVAKDGISLSVKDKTIRQTKEFVGSHTALVAITALALIGIIAFIVAGKAKRRKRKR